MFSGAKNKLQQWRQRKSPAKTMATLQKEDYLKRIQEIAGNLKNLEHECHSVIGQLNQQVTALSEINEDVTVPEEKIDLLDQIVSNIHKGLQQSEEFSTFMELVDSLNAEIKKNNSELKDLQRQAASLFNENRKLRTELQIFQDHQERSEIRGVELGIQNEHLTFMNSLPAERETLFEKDEKTEEQKEDEEEERFAIQHVFAIPFLEADDGIENEVLDTMDFSGNTRMKILFDLIKKYIEEKQYDIAIPLLKTTTEDLMSSLDPQDKMILSMMDVLVIVYNLTRRYKDSIEIHEQILQIRREKMPDDKIGLAKTLSSLAIQYGRTGKIKTARNFSRQALELKIKIFGDRDLETAKELHNIGILYSYDAKYPKAIDCLKSAIQILRTCSKRSVQCLAEAAINLASVHIQNDELIEAKCLFMSVTDFLNMQLDKMLKGKAFISDILRDENILEEVSDIENKKEIKKIVDLVIGVKEKSAVVSHITLDDCNELAAKYEKVSISDKDI